MTKDELRKRMRQARRNVPPSLRAELSAEICAHILARADVRAAIEAKRPFAAYLATPEEIDLSVLIDHLWAAECPVAVPAWRHGGYELAQYGRETPLVAGPMGIHEPADVGTCVVTPSVWIVPGLAFTVKGGRLGYGGGWYDRFLSATAPSVVSLGVAYPFQIVPELPEESHDVQLTDVVVATGGAR